MQYYNIIFKGFPLKAKADVRIYNDGDNDTPDSPPYCNIEELYQGESEENVFDLVYLVMSASDYREMQDLVIKEHEDNL